MEERKGGRSVADLEWQRDRFRTHIRAARQCGKPLIIHTRASSADTVAILKEEGEDGSPGAPAACSTASPRTPEVARAALDLGFIHLVFRHPDLQERGRPARGGEVRAAGPLLIETDSPYLAPVPYRGKVNNPSYVPYVAAQLAELRGCRWRRSRSHQPQFRAPVPGVQS
jgi:TatD DNase family protein